MTEKVIYPVLVNFFDAYLAERDVQKTLDLCAEDLYSVGTGEGEVAVNREEFKKLLEMEFATLPDPIRYHIFDYTEKQCGEHCWLCFCRVETALEQEENPVYYRTRLSAVFREENGKFLASSFHMSEASRLQEHEEFFPLRFISENAKKLSENARRELMDLVCQMMPGGIIGGYIEEGFPLYVINKNMLEMMGYTYEEFVDAFDGMVANSICDEDVERVSREVFAKMEDGNEYTIEYRVKKKDGGYIWVHDVGRKIVAEDGRNAIISVLVDVSKDVRMRTQLQEEIAKDFLTGVNNRKGGEILVREKMKLEEPYIFFMLDLDNFKKVNDFFGHEEGDKMLRIAADLLVNTFRQTDVVIRMGGDEFAVLAQPCGDARALQEKAERVIAQYTEKAWKMYGKTDISISIGGVYGKKSRTFLELYRLADDVLYEVKQSGKGKCMIRCAEEISSEAAI